MQSVYTCTYGIIFFGTPHRGANKARLLRSLKKIVSLALPKSVLETDSSLLHALEKESEILQDIAEHFKGMMRYFHIFFFWEQERTNFGYTRDYIVSQTSAAPIIPDTERSGIAANHRRMCKFESKDEAGFRTVVAALMRYARDAPGAIGHRTAEARAKLEAERWNEARELVRDLGREGREESSFSREQGTRMLNSANGIPELRDRVIGVEEQNGGLQSSAEAGASTATQVQHYHLRGR